MDALALPSQPSLIQGSVKKFRQVEIVSLISNVKRYPNTQKMYIKCRRAVSLRWLSNGNFNIQTIYSLVWHLPFLYCILHVNAT